jgi:hypothetical protein
MHLQPVQAGSSLRNEIRENPAQLQRYRDALLHPLLAANIGTASNLDKPDRELTKRRTGTECGRRRSLGAAEGGKHVRADMEG